VYNRLEGKCEVAIKSETENILLFSHERDFAWHLTRIKDHALKFQCCRWNGLQPSPFPHFNGGRGYADIRGVEEDGAIIRTTAE
jgi:hypothetical protein